MTTYFDDPTPAEFNPVSIRRYDNARTLAQLRELQAINERRRELEQEHLSYIVGQTQLDPDFRDPISTYVEKIVHFNHEAETLCGIGARKANGLRAAGVL